MRRNGGELLDHLLALGFSDAFDETLKSFARQTIRPVPAGDSIHGLRNSFGRHRADGETVGARIVGPLAAQQNLKMGDCVAVLIPADAVEAQIGDVVLATGIEAAADLDTESAKRFIPFG